MRVNEGRVGASLLAILLLAGCGAQGNVYSGPPAPAGTVDTQPVPEAPPAPAAPLHNYVYEQDGQYGYQPQLSPDQINAGAASAPLVMFRYLGESRGVYRAQSQTAPFTGVLSCSAPCDYITVLTYYADGEIAARQVMPGNNNSIAAEVMQDAMNGQLIPYDQRPAAKAAAKAAAAKRAARAAWLAAQARRGPYVTTASALYAAYRHNQRAILHVLDGRPLQVSGIVWAASEDSPGDLELDLRTGSYPLNLNFPPSQYGAVHGVRIGQSITALCQELGSGLPPEASGASCQLLDKQSEQSPADLAPTGMQPQPKAPIEPAVTAAAALPPTTATAPDSSCLRYFNYLRSTGQLHSDPSTDYDACKHVAAQ